MSLKYEYSGNLKKFLYVCYICAAVSGTFNHENIINYKENDWGRVSTGNILSVGLCAKALSCTGSF